MKRFLRPSQDDDGLDVSLSTLMPAKPIAILIPDLRRRELAHGFRPNRTTCRGAVRVVRPVRSRSDGWGLCHRSPVTVTQLEYPDVLSIFNYKKAPVFGRAPRKHLQSHHRAIQYKSGPSCYLAGAGMPGNMCQWSHTEIRIDGDDAAN
jgi:hypothetical protein